MGQFCGMFFTGFKDNTNPYPQEVYVNIFVNAINVFLGVYAMSSINRKQFSFKERRDYF